VPEEPLWLDITAFLAAWANLPTTVPQSVNLTALRGRLLNQRELKPAAVASGGSAPGR